MGCSAKQVGSGAGLIELGAGQIETVFFAVGLSFERLWFFVEVPIGRFAFGKH